MPFKPSSSLSLRQDMLHFWYLARLWGDTGLRHAHTSLFAEAPYLLPGLHCWAKTQSFGMRKACRDIADMNPQGINNKLVTHHSWFASPLSSPTREGLCSSNWGRRGCGPKLRPSIIGWQMPISGGQGESWGGGCAHRSFQPWYSWVSCCRARQSSWQERRPKSSEAKLLEAGVILSWIELMFCSTKAHHSKCPAKQT